MAAKIDYAAAMNNAAQSILMDKVDRKLSGMNPDERKKFLAKLVQDNEEVSQGGK